MTSTTRQEALQLKVALRNIRPPVWRRLLVPARLTLAQLHDAIQVAFGWGDCHLHLFLVHDEEYGPRDPDGAVEDVSSEEVSLAQLGLKPKARIRYEYDFGDNWIHDITVEKALVPEDPTMAPVCIGGKRACPPEDCGGSGGYEDLVIALEDPAHPRHEEFCEWLDDAWDPEAFNLEEVNARLMARCAPIQTRTPTPRKP